MSAVKEVVITIRLTFTGDDAADSANDIVSDVLDGGALQDNINRWAVDRGLDLTVAQAENYREWKLVLGHECGKGD